MKIGVTSSRSNGGAMVKKTDWPAALKKHAENIDAAAECFKAFLGTDAEDMVESLTEIAAQFRSDAEEYLAFDRAIEIEEQNEAKT